MSLPGMKDWILASNVCRMTVTMEVGGSAGGKGGEVACCTENAAIKRCRLVLMLSGFGKPSKKFRLILATTTSLTTAGNDIELTTLQQ